MEAHSVHLTQMAYIPCNEYTAPSEICSLIGAVQVLIRDCVCFSLAITSPFTLIKGLVER